MHKIVDAQGAWGSGRLRRGSTAPEVLRMFAALLRTMPVPSGIGSRLPHGFHEAPGGRLTGPPCLAPSQPAAELQLLPGCTRALRRNRGGPGAAGAPDRSRRQGRTRARGRARRGRRGRAGVRA